MDLGLDTVASFVAARHGGPVDRVELVGAGAWTTCYGYFFAGRELVIRFGAEDWAFEMDRRAARFASPALPVPQVLDIGSAFGGHFAISTRARGRYLEDLDEAGWRAVLPAVHRALAAIHAVDLDGTSGYGGWHADGNAWYPTWRDTLLAIAGTPSEIATGMGAASSTYEEGLRLLAAEPVADPRRTLLHGDLLHRNVLVTGTRIAAVLDWQCSLYGDELYDYAWLEFWAPWHPGLAAVLPDLPLPDVPDRVARMRWCMLAIGCNHLRYNAGLGRWDELEATEGRLREVMA